jgi:hypothetical protein
MLCVLAMMKSLGCGDSRAWPEEFLVLLRMSLLQHIPTLKGELWGLANLLRYKEEGVETASIVDNYERGGTAGGCAQHWCCGEGVG